jgi:hypothetical protein
VPPEHRSSTKRCGNGVGASSKVFPLDGTDYHAGTARTSPFSPRTASTQRVTFRRNLPDLNRTPDGPRLGTGPGQAAQHVLARVLVQVGPDTEPSAHLRPFAPHEPLVLLTQQLAYGRILKDAPPEGLSRAPHARHQQVVRIEGLEMRTRKVNVFGRRIFSVTRPASGSARIALRATSASTSPVTPLLHLRRR